MRWMNLVRIKQSEVSQKEKNKYHILMHIYRIWKDGTDEPICRALMGTDLWTQWVGEGEGGTNGEISMEAYTLPDVK